MAIGHILEDAKDAAFLHLVGRFDSVSERHPSSARLIKGGLLRVVPLRPLGLANGKQCFDVGHQ
jgi:hypothetical protein